MNVAHGIKPSFSCGACDKTFITRSQLTIHLNSFHKLGEPISCEQCDYKCYEKRAIKKHMVKHCKDELFACKYCKKMFPRKTTLNFHERIHTGDKRKVCPKCGEAFVQKASLNYHMVKYHPNAV